MLKEDRRQNSSVELRRTVNGGYGRPSLSLLLSFRRTGHRPVPARTKERHEGLKAPILAHDYSCGSIDYPGSSSRFFEMNELELVTRIFASWNQLDGWLTRRGGSRCLDASN